MHTWTIISGGGLFTMAAYGLTQSLNAAPPERYVWSESDPETYLQEKLGELQASTGILSSDDLRGYDQDQFLRPTSVETAFNGKPQLSGMGDRAAAAPAPVNAKPVTPRIANIAPPTQVAQPTVAWRQPSRQSLFVSRSSPPPRVSAPATSAASAAVTISAAQAATPPANPPSPRIESASRAFTGSAPASPTVERVPSPTSIESASVGSPSSVVATVPASERTASPAPIESVEADVEELGTATNQRIALRAGRSTRISGEPMSELRRGLSTLMCQQSLAAAALEASPHRCAKHISQPPQHTHTSSAATPNKPLLQPEVAPAAADLGALPAVQPQPQTTQG